MRRTVFRAVLSHPRTILHGVIRVPGDGIVVEFSEGDQKGVEGSVDGERGDYAAFNRFCGRVLSFQEIAERQKGILEPVVLCPV